MLKKPGRYYYGHMFGMMMLSSVWMYLRHLIPGYNLTDDNVDDHQNFFQQDQIAFIFVLARVFVAIGLIGVRMYWQICAGSFFIITLSLR